MDEPFRGVKVVPVRAVSVISGIHMMVVMVPLAKCHEGYQPAVAAGV